MEERVQKIIAAAGIASRRAAEQLILDGRVKVNGAVVTELGTKADPDRDHIKVDGKLVNPRQPKTYVMLNKPVGYVTTMSDPEGRPVVADLLQGVKVRVYPVGRLDYDTEGLLLLTNDGDFAHLVTHPRHELPKTYLVKVKGVMEDRDVESLERGVFLKDGKTAPARVRRLRKEEANSWVEITIHEGRKRQVRRMIDHTGKSVIKLKRTGIGSLGLGDLPLGSYRHLTADEMKKLKETAQGNEISIAGQLMPGGTVSVPSGPAGARRELTFIEGPKPKKRQPVTRAPRRERDGRRPAKVWAEGRKTGERGARDRFGEGGTRRPVQRGPRLEGRGTWPEKRRERSPFGRPDRSSEGKAPRTGEGFKSREGQGRSFGGRTALPGQRGLRPEGRGAWPEKRRERPPFGRPDRSGRSRGVRTGEGFRPRAGEARPFGSGSASAEQRGARSADRRPWQAAKRASGAESMDSRPRTGGRRTPGLKIGRSRPGNNRDRKGRGPGRS